MEENKRRILEDIDFFMNHLTGINEVLIRLSSAQVITEDEREYLNHQKTSQEKIYTLFINISKRATESTLLKVIRALNDSCNNHIAERLQKYMRTKEKIVDDFTRRFPKWWPGKKDRNFSYVERKVNEIDIVESIKQLMVKENRHTSTSQTTSNKLSVCGFGGIGKTTLAKSFASRYEHLFDFIFWIDSEGNQIISNLKNLARDLGIEFSKKKIYSTFSELKCLFIFDNVDFMDNEHGVEIYLSNHHRHYSLITTRDKKRRGDDLFSQIDYFELKKFSEEEALEFLKRSLGSKVGALDLSELKILCHELDYLPLALQHAAAMISKFEDQENISDFVQRLCQSSTLLKHSGNIDDYQSSITNTLQISIEQIEKNETYGELGLEFLNLFSFFQADNINLSILDDYENHPDSVIKQCFDFLSQYSLISVDSHDSSNKNPICSTNSKTVSIHRLLQQVLNSRLSEKSKIQLLRKLMSHLLSKSEFFKSVNKCNGDNSFFQHSCAIWHHAESHEELINEFWRFPFSILEYHQSQPNEDDDKEDVYFFMNEVLSTFEKMKTQNQLAICCAKVALAWITIMNDDYDDDKKSEFKSLLEEVKDTSYYSLTSPWTDIYYHASFGLAIINLFDAESLSGESSESDESYGEEGGLILTIKKWFFKKKRKTKNTPRSALSSLENIYKKLEFNTHYDISPHLFDVIANDGNDFEGSDLWPCFDFTKPLPKAYVGIMMIFMMHEKENFSKQIIKYCKELKNYSLPDDRITPFMLFFELAGKKSKRLMVGGMLETFSVTVSLVTSLSTSGRLTKFDLDFFKFIASGCIEGCSELKMYDDIKNVCLQYASILLDIDEASQNVWDLREVIDNAAEGLSEAYDETLKLFRGLFCYIMSYNDSNDNETKSYHFQELEGEIVNKLVMASKNEEINLEINTLKFIAFECLKYKKDELIHYAFSGILNSSSDMNHPEVVELMAIIYDKFAKNMKLEQHKSETFIRLLTFARSYLECLASTMNIDKIKLIVEDVFSHIDLVSESSLDYLLSFNKKSSKILEEAGEIQLSLAQNEVCFPKFSDYFEKCDDISYEWLHKLQSLTIELGQLYRICDQEEKATEIYNVTSKLIISKIDNISSPVEIQKMVKEQPQSDANLQDPLYAMKISDIIQILLPMLQDMAVILSEESISTLIVTKGEEILFKMINDYITFHDRIAFCHLKCNNINLLPEHYEDMIKTVYGLKTYITKNQFNDLLESIMATTLKEMPEGFNFSLLDEIRLKFEGNSSKLVKTANKIIFDEELD